MNLNRKSQATQLARREIKFETFDEVLDDARHLAKVGYHRVGKWSLGLVSDHLCRFMNQSLDGFDFTAPFYITLARPILRMMYLGKILDGQQLKAGMPTAPSLRPADWADDSTAVQQLSDSIARIKSSHAQFVPSPMFGKLTPDQWRKIHLWHCQHHLSFLLPAARQST